MQNKLANAKPFLFEKSFDDPTTVKLTKRQRVEQEAIESAAAEAARIAAETPPPPTFSEEELAVAKATAYEEGRQAGLQEANNDISANAASILQVITGQLAVLHDKQELANETHAATLAQITSEIVSKLLPFYAHSHGAQEIVTFVRDCITPILDDSRVIIKLSAEMKDLTEDQIQQAAEEAGFEGRLLIITDEAMGPADAKVDWDGGGAERNWDDIWSEINEAIAHVSHLAEGMEAETIGLSTDSDAITPEEISAPEPSALEQVVADASDMIDNQPQTTEPTLAEPTDTNIIDETPGSGDQNGG